MPFACFALLLPLAAPQDPLSLEARREDLYALVDLLRSHHPEPLLRATEEDWEAALGQASQRLGGSGDLGFYLELARVIALTHDGHTRIGPWPRLRGRFADEARPLRLRTFADGLFVMALPEEFGDSLGARVVTIEGTPVEEAFARLLPYLPADNDQGARLDAARQLVVPGVLAHLGLDDGRPGTTYGLESADGSALELSLETGLSNAPPVTEWLDLEHSSTAAEALWQRRRGDNAWFEALTDEVLYFQFNEVSEATGRPLRRVAEALFAELDRRPEARLVIDLRHNGGGNNYLNQPLIHGLIRDRRFQRPGTLYVLTSPRTFSAAMSFSAAVERETQALFVGDPTGAGPNHAGDAENHTLPNSKIGLRISSLWWQGSDPRDPRRAIQPDLPAPLTCAAYLAGEDPALEAALGHVPSPETAITDPNRRWGRANQHR